MRNLDDSYLAELIMKVSQPVTIFSIVTGLSKYGFSPHRSGYHDKTVNKYCLNVPYVDDNKDKKVARIYFKVPVDSTGYPLSEFKCTDRSDISVVIEDLKF